MYTKVLLLPLFPYNEEAPRLFIHRMEIHMITLRSLCLTLPAIMVLLQFLHHFGRIFINIDPIPTFTDYVLKRGLKPTEIVVLLPCKLNTVKQLLLCNFARSFDTLSELLLHNLLQI